MVTMRYAFWNASFLVWACVQSFVGATVPTWQYDCPEDVSRVIPLSPSALCESDGAATNAADGSIATAWGCLVYGSGLNISFDRPYRLKEIMVQSDRPSKRFEVYTNEGVYIQELRPGRAFAPSSTFITSALYFQPVKFPGSIQEVDVSGYPCYIDCGETQFHNGTQCRNYTQCNPGSIVQSQPSFTSDRTCSTCTGNTDYQDEVNQASCKPVSNCLPGTEIDLEVTRSSDRTCLNCVDQLTYQPSANQFSCLPVTECAPGSGASAPATLTNDRVCTACINGETYQPTISGSSCLPVRGCAPGTRENLPPTTSSDRSCVLCDLGVTYQDTANQSTCKTVKDCLPGSTQTGAPTMTSDRVCIDCTLGVDYQSNTNQISCLAVSPVCNAGNYETAAPTLTSDRSCDSCIFNVTFQPLRNQSECLPVTPPCASNAKELAAPTLSSDRVCQEYASLPVFDMLEQTVYHISPNTPAGVIVARTPATHISNPLTYSLVDSLGGRLSIDQDGTITVHGWDSSMGRVSIEVRAEDNSTYCVTTTTNFGPGPCRASVQLLLHTTDIVGCKTEVKHAVVDVTALPEVETIGGVLSSAETVLLNISHPANFSYPFGHTIREARVFHSIEGAPITCVTNVTIVYGVQLDVEELTSTLLANGQRRTTLLDSTGTSTSSPFGYLLMDPAAMGFSALVSSVSGVISMDSSENISSCLEVSLEWCDISLSSSQTAALTRVPASLVVEIGFSEESSVQSLDFTTGEKTSISSDGSCITLEGRSGAVTESLVIRYMIISLLHNLTESARTGNLSSVVTDPKLYVPVHLSSLVALSWSNSNGVVPDNRVVVEDTEAPVWSQCPTNIVVEARSDGSGVAVWPPPIAIDNVGVASIMATHESGDNFSVIESPHIVAYTATDRAGLEAVCSFQVTVHIPESAIANIESLVNTSALGVTLRTVSTTMVYSDVLASDTLHLPGVSDFSIDLNNKAGIRFTIKPLGDDRFALNFRGEAITSYLSLDVAWLQEGTSASQIPNLVAGELVPARVTVEFVDMRNLSTFQSIPSPRLTQDVVLSTGGELLQAQVQSERLSEGTFSSISIEFSFPAGLAGYRTRRAATLTNYSLLNGRQIAFSYVTSSVENYTRTSGFLDIYDITPPEIVGCPSHIVINNIAGTNYAEVLWTAPTTADGTIELVSPASAAPGSRFEVHPISSPHTVTYRATDIRGNEAFCKFNITVMDIDAPSISCGRHSAILADDRSTIAVSELDIQPIATDNSGTVTVTAMSSLSLGIGTDQPVAFLAVDEAGNNATCDVLITVEDRTSPVLKACPVDLSTPIEDGSSNKKSVSWTPPTARDNVAVASLSSSHALGSEFFIGVTTVVYTATDSSGNAASCSFVVTVSGGVADATASGNDTSSDQIIISVLVVAVVLIIAAAVVVKLRMDRKEKNKPASFDEIMASLAKLLEQDEFRTPREIMRANIKILDHLGEGNFGEVYKGLLSEPPITPYLVAMKSLNINDADAKRSLLSEAAVMAQFNHPNIIALIGVCTVCPDDEPMLAILEFAEHGALNSYLQNHTPNMFWKDLIAGDVATALAYLAKKTFVHRDVAARNVLISSERRAKLADFGMSRDVEESSYYRSKGGEIPVRWTSPEALEHGRFSSASDCWAFGILLYELHTQGDTPYSNMNNAKVWISVQDGYRLPIPDGCPPLVYQQMYACWHETPSSRPTFSDLALFFRGRADPQDSPADLDDYDMSEEDDADNDKSAIQLERYVPLISEGGDGACTDRNSAAYADPEVDGTATPVAQAVVPASEGLYPMSIPIVESQIGKREIMPCDSRVNVQSSPKPYTPRASLEWDDALSPTARQRGSPNGMIYDDLRSRSITPTPPSPRPERSKEALLEVKTGGTYGGAFSNSHVARLLSRSSRKSFQGIPCSLEPDHTNELARRESIGSIEYESDGSEELLDEQAECDLPASVASALAGVFISSPCSSRSSSVQRRATVRNYDDRSGSALARTDSEDSERFSGSGSLTPLRRRTVRREIPVEPDTQ